MIDYWEDIMKTIKEYSSVDPIETVMTVPRFSISAEDGLFLDVPDTKAPLWYGNFGAGKLAIYEAIQSGSVKENTMAIVAVYIPDGMVSFTYFATYYKEGGINQKIMATINDILPAYSQWVQEQRDSEIANGNTITFH